MLMFVLLSALTVSLVAGQGPDCQAFEIQIGWNQGSPRPVGLVENAPLPDGCELVSHDCTPDLGYERLFLCSPIKMFCSQSFCHDSAQPCFCHRYLRCGSRGRVVQPLYDRPPNCRCV